MGKSLRYLLISLLAVGLTNALFSGIVPRESNNTTATEKDLLIRIFSSRDGKTVCEKTLADHADIGEFSCSFKGHEEDFEHGLNSFEMEVYSNTTGKRYLHQELAGIVHFDETLLDGYYRHFIVDDEHEHKAYFKRVVLAGGASVLLNLLLLHTPLFHVLWFPFKVFGFPFQLLGWLFFGSSPRPPPPPPPPPPRGGDGGGGMGFGGRLRQFGDAAIPRVQNVYRGLQSGVSIGVQSVRTSVLPRAGNVLRKVGGGVSAGAETIRTVVLPRAGEAARGIGGGISDGVSASVQFTNREVLPRAGGVLRGVGDGVSTGVHSIKEDVLPRVGDTLKGLGHSVSRGVQVVTSSIPSLSEIELPSSVSDTLETVKREVTARKTLIAYGALALVAMRVLLPAPAAGIQVASVVGSSFRSDTKATTKPKPKCVSSGKGSSKKNVVVEGGWKRMVDDAQNALSDVVSTVSKQFEFNKQGSSSSNNNKSNNKKKVQQSTKSRISSVSESSNFLSEQFPRSAAALTSLQQRLGDLNEHVELLINNTTQSTVRSWQPPQKATSAVKSRKPNVKPIMKKPVIKTTPVQSKKPEVKPIMKKPSLKIVPAVQSKKPEVKPVIKRPALPTAPDLSKAKTVASPKPSVSRESTGRSPTTNKIFGFQLKPKDVNAPKPVLIQLAEVIEDTVGAVAQGVVMTGQAIRFVANTTSVAYWEGSNAAKAHVRSGLRVMFLDAKRRKERKVELAIERARGYDQSGKKTTKGTMLTTTRSSSMARSSPIVSSLRCPLRQWTDNDSDLSTSLGAVKIGLKDGKDKIKNSDPRRRPSPPLPLARATPVIHPVKQTTNKKVAVPPGANKNKPPSTTTSVFFTMKPLAAVTTNILSIGSKTVEMSLNAVRRARDSFSSLSKQSVQVLMHLNLP